MALIPKPLPTESPKAFRAFKIWVELGTDRSIREVGRRLGCSDQNIDKWIAKYDWQGRLSTLMADEAEREGLAATKAAQKYAMEREKLRLKHERNMSGYLKGVGKVIQQMLRMPVGPENFNWGQLARLLEQFDRSHRLILGMPTGRAELTGLDGEPLKLGTQAQITNIIVQRDGQSDNVARIYYDYFRKHPEHKQAKRYIREFEELRDAGNGNGKGNGS